MNALTTTQAHADITARVGELLEQGDREFAKYLLEADPNWVAAMAEADRVAEEVLRAVQYEFTEWSRAEPAARALYRCLLTPDAGLIYSEYFMRRWSERAMEQFLSPEIDGGQFEMVIGGE